MQIPLHLETGSGVPSAWHEFSSGSAKLAASPSLMIPVLCPAQALLLAFTQTSKLQPAAYVLNHLLYLALVCCTAGGFCARLVGPRKFHIRGCVGWWSKDSFGVLSPGRQLECDLFRTASKRSVEADQDLL